MFIKEGPSEKDVLQFFRIIMRHYNTGRPIVECIGEYVKATDNQEMRMICKTVHRQMMNGSDFAPALEKAPGSVFPPFVVQFIRVGEHNNQLERFMEKIIHQLKQNITIRRRISQATLMPKISMTILIGAFIFLVYYLIPKLATVLNELKIDLPLITKIELAFGNFLTTFWWILPLIVFVVVAIVRLKAKNSPVEYSLWGLRVPFYKDIVYYKIHYNFCQIFSLCKSSGLRSIESLQYTAIALDNTYMRQMLKTASTLMVRGSTLPDSIRKADTEHILSSEVISMLETGESTNKTAEIMENEAEAYLEELDGVMETIGDKISVTVMAPSFGAMLLIFGALEYPFIQISQNFGKISRGGM